MVGLHCRLQKFNASLIANRGLGDDCQGFNRRYNQRLGGFRRSKRYMSR
jgi:hypothetical protein